MAGKLTPAADIYSFGIMMWEMVARSQPFAGLHHGEIIHRVVTEDLRPGCDCWHTYMPVVDRVASNQTTIKQVWCHGQLLALGT